jgi:GntR family transcriptional regulator
MLTIDPDSDTPLVEQIVAAVRLAIAGGEVRPGDELPSVRQLANDLGINLNTVARAYRVLHGQGLLHGARGRNTRVTATVETPGVAPSLARTRAARAIGSAIADAKLAGLSLPETEAAIAAQLRWIWRDASRRPA